MKEPPNIAQCNTTEPYTIPENINHVKQNYIQSIIDS